LHRQPVLMPTRLADLGRPARRVQHRAPATARIRQSRCTLAIPPAHDLARTNEPDISARRSMNSSDCRFVLAAAPRCDLADELAAAVLAALLGISVDTPPAAGAHSSNETGPATSPNGTDNPRDPSRRDRHGRYGTPSVRRVVVGTNHPSWVLRLPPPHRASSRAGVMGISVASSAVISDEGQLLR